MDPGCTAGALVPGTEASSWNRPDPSAALRGRPVGRPVGVVGLLVASSLAVVWTSSGGAGGPAPAATVSSMGQLESGGGVVESALFFAPRGAGARTA